MLPHLTSQLAGNATPAHGYSSSCAVDCEVAQGFVAPAFGVKLAGPAKRSPPPNGTCKAD